MAIVLYWTYFLAQTVGSFLIFSLAIKYFHSMHQTDLLRVLEGRGCVFCMLVVFFPFFFLKIHTLKTKILLEYNCAIEVRSAALPLQEIIGVLLPRELKTFTKAKKKK